jgi:hypothetical protein
MAGTTWGRMRRNNEVGCDGGDRHEQSEQPSDQIKILNLIAEFLILIVVYLSGE